MSRTDSLHAPSAVREILERHGHRADKAFGQNFLIDGQVLDTVVRAAELSSDDTVLEVGPGLGVLTRELCERAGRVVAVELDRRLLPVLQETVGDAPNLELVHGDAMHFDFDLLPAGTLLVANLPYNIATPLLIQALESLIFSRLVVMVQKEVAERLIARPSSSAYGAVSLIVAHFARAKIVKSVRPGSFYPAPEVTSAIVRLDVDPQAQPAPALFRLVHDAFRHRRKTLSRNLEMAGYSRARVLSALESLQLDSRVRGEALALEQFVELQAALESEAHGAGS